jgi:hypothetical protein
MASCLAVITWGVGAYLEPIAVPLGWSFLACGVVAAVVAGFLVWRVEWSARLKQTGRLKLTQLVDEGDRLLAPYKQSVERLSTPSGEISSLLKWREECERVVKAECPSAWPHFADIDQIKGIGLAEAVRIRIKRVRDVLEETARA